MDWRSTCGQTGACMKAGGEEGKHMVKANSPGHLELPMRACSSRVGWKGLVFSLDPTWIHIVGHRAPIGNTGMDRSVMQMETYILGYGNGRCKMGMGVTFGKMVTSI